MDLKVALEIIGSAYNLDIEALQVYASEDTIGGWDGDEALKGWPVGSLWGVEGKVLYALTRATQPAVVAELGTAAGCSAMHFYTGLKANDYGHLFCLDKNIRPDIRIPEGAKSEISFISGDGVESLKAMKKQDYELDLFFEDGPHSAEYTRAAWAAAMPMITPGGFIVSHDAMHFLVGDAVRRGIQESGVDDVLYLDIAPSDCGLAIWRKPLPQLETLPDEQAPKEAPPAEKPARKRASRRRKGV